MSEGRLKERIKQYLDLLPLLPSCYLDVLGKPSENKPCIVFLADRNATNNVINQIFEEAKKEFPDIVGDAGNMRNCSQCEEKIKWFLKYFGENRRV